MYNKFTITSTEAIKYMDNNGALVLSYVHKLYREIINKERFQQSEKEWGEWWVMHYIMAAIYLAGRAEGKRDERKRRKGIRK